MSETVNSSLRTAVKGTAIVLFGSVVGMLLGFASRIVLARHLTKEEFGIYSLFLAAVSIISMVATLGVQEGSTRYFYPSWRR